MSFPIIGDVGNTYHTYLVYRDGEGNAEVIRGGPNTSIGSDFFDLQINVGVDISDTLDSYSTGTPIQDRIITKLDLGTQDINQVWNSAVTTENSIDPRIDYEINLSPPTTLFGLIANVANIAINNQIILPEDAQVCHSVTGTILNEMGFNIDDVLEQSNMTKVSVNGIETNLLDIDILDIGYVDQLSESVSSVFNVENNSDFDVIIGESLKTQNIIQTQYNEAINNNSSLAEWLKQDSTKIKLDSADQGIVKNLEKMGVKQVSIDNQTYTIQSGDNLSQIAQANNTTVDKLIENNSWLTQDNRISQDGSYALIKPGEKLNLTVDNKITGYGIDDTKTLN